MDKLKSHRREAKGVAREVPQIKEWEAKFIPYLAIQLKRYTLL